MLTYQVRVLTGDHDSLKLGVATHEHLVDVLAANVTEARLVACQMAAAVMVDGVPMGDDVITDSTLTTF